MAITSGGFYTQPTPLLGALQFDIHRPSSGTARVVRGISDSASSLLGLTREAGVSFNLSEVGSQFSSSMARGVSGFFALTADVRDAAAALSDSVNLNQLEAATPDPDTVINAAQSLASAVNSLRSFIQDNSDVLDPSLLSHVDLAMDNYSLSSTLDDIGITVNSDGELLVDEGVLRTQLEADPSYAGIALGLTSGLAARELDISSSILTGDSVSVRPFPFADGRTDFLLTTAEPAEYLPTGRFVSLLV